MNTGRTALNGIAEFAATRETSARCNDPFLANEVNLTAFEAQSNGIVPDTYLHSRVFLNIRAD